MRRGIVVAGMLLAAPAAAQQAFIEGVYLRSVEQCEKARKDGLQAVFGRGDVAMTARGIEGIEYHCDFLEVLRGNRSPGWRVSALCEEPGYAYPETLAVMPRGEGELELTAASDMRNEDENSGNSGMWFHCKDVPLP